MKKLTTPLFYFLAALFLFSCTTQRIGQFRKFADAGKTYSGAVTELLQEAGNVAIDADNENMFFNHGGFDETNRRKVYEAHTAGLKEFLKILDDCRKHTRLLGDYFTNMAALADSRSGETIGEKSGKIIEELNKIHPPLENAKIGGVTVRDFLAESVPPVVNLLKKNALENELRQNGKTIVRELDLQVALVSALTESLQSDLETITNYSETTVVKPYLSGSKLPESWKKERKALLLLASASKLAGNAKNASAELRKAFTCLMENKIKPSDLNDLFAEINELIGFIELIRKNNPN